LDEWQKMVTLPDISGYLHISRGFCYPDWDGISDVIGKNVPEAMWNAAWEAASRSWVEKIREKLGGGYRIHETPNFMILSEAPMRIIMDACASFEDSLKRIVSSLEGVASDEGYGKHVVMMFAGIDDYYDYISHFYPEGEHPMTGGLCLSGGGYVHFAFPTTDYSSYRSVLVHELSHGCLGHLPIPTWLNEALAMRMEQLICNADIFQLNQEICDKHAAYWNEESIQTFWTGVSWAVTDDGFELSYNLARILWRKIEVDLAAPRAAILDFVAEAHFEDAGEAAFQAIFGLSLGDLVMDFLGEGLWAPEPAKWTGKPLMAQPDLDDE